MAHYFKSQSRIVILLLSMCGVSQLAQAQAVNNSFEEAIGANTYFGGFGTFNWVDGGNYGIANHDGSEAFLSAVGTDYFDLGLEKDLGGTINDSIYNVSFYIGKYYGSGVTFSDFSQLIIGGFDGTMQWNQTPEPTIDGVWYQWSGTYTPGYSDLGMHFTFTAVFDLLSTHSIAMDGPVIALAGFGTSASSINSEHVIKLFPDPVQDILVLETASNEQALLQITNAIGQIVFAAKISSSKNEIDVSKFVPGIYQVILVSSSGKYSSRFLKQ